MENSVGVIGIGAMGTPMVENFLEAGKAVFVFDVSKEAVAKAVAKGAVAADSPKDMVSKTKTIVSIVPNDAVLKKIAIENDDAILKAEDCSGLVHISCSTVSPATSRQVAPVHTQKGAEFVGAPIFARADGVKRKEASFVVGGAPDAVKRAKEILDLTSNRVFVFGEDAGAGNVVKLCGNFMIASAIESSAEALTLAEKNGLDRSAVMEMLSSTIFDCLIYKGYGMRVAKRQHTPGEELVGPGFQLDLGGKDIDLVLGCGKESNVPMPFASVLRDRFLAGKAKGRGKMDWSAISLQVSEDAGDEPLAKKRKEE